MALVKWEKDETVAIITMTAGANRQNLTFGKEVKQAIDDILEDNSNNGPELILNFSLNYYF